MKGRRAACVVKGWLVFLSLAAVAGPGQASVPEPMPGTEPNDLVKPQVTPSEAVAKALKNLDAPKYDGGHPNDSGFPTKADLPEDYYSPSDVRKD